MILNLEIMTLDHLDKFKAREDILINVTEVCSRMLEDGNFKMFTVLDDKKPVMILAVQYITGNVGELIVYPATCFKAYTEFFRTSELFLEGVMEQLELTRLQASINSEKPKFIKWIETFGFVREGLMKSFGTNHEDYYLYSYTGRGL